MHHRRELYLSYAVEERNDNAKPTTKPSTVSKMLLTPTYIRVSGSDAQAL